MRRGLIFLTCAVGALLTLGRIVPYCFATDKKEVVYEGKGINQWIAALTDKDFATHKRAEQVLNGFGKAAVPALIQALKNDDENLRDEAAYVLTSLGSQAATAVPALIEAVKDRSPKVREQAASALAEIGPAAKAAIPVLTDALTEEDPHVRVSVAVALSRLDPERTPAMVKRLIHALENEDEGVRSDAVDALCTIGPPAKAAIPQLTDRFKKASGEWTRAFTIRAVAKIDPNPKTISLLIDALKDKDVPVRIYATQGLHDIGPSATAAIDPLIKSLRDDAKGVRRSAAGALGAMGAKARSAVTPLTEALKDSDAGVRIHSACALARIDRDKTPAMVDRLIVFLKDKNVEVCEDAAYALGEIGPPARAALPQLSDVLKNKLEVRRIAGIAIQKIDSDTAQRLGIP